MTKVEELLTKHPNLTKLEAVKIITEKNKRKKERKSEKSDRNNEKRIKNEGNRSSTDKI